MCGICGVVGRADEAVVVGMAESLAHRGPDGQGIRSFPGRDGSPPVVLGHRRLSIIDTSERGAQPMSYAAGRYWITYNGEIYNFRELRAELERDGFRFRSDCDTEVLLALYARDGARALDRLNGIFAFAVWDTELRELFLARDRLGIKPLYYAEAGGVFAFASEIKAMLPVLPPTRLRPEAVADYLTFLWVPDPDTAFDGIWKLPPGHFASYRDGRLTIKQYWDLTFDVEERSEAEWVAVVREAVGAAVRRQMVSDVPIGSFLSGGVDSSAIVAEMASAAGNVSTYTIGFTAADLAHETVPDDVRYARTMGEFPGVEYHEQILDPNVVELLPKAIYHLDEPVADPAAISTYLVCSAAREQLTVILSGMGGDEVFAGYPRYLADRIAGVADALPLAARRRIESLVARHVTLGRPGRLRGPRRDLMKLMRGIAADPAERYLTYCSYYRPDELPKILSPDLRAAIGDHDPFRRHRDYFARVAGEDWLNRLLYVDAKTFLPCLNLTYTDKMSMAASTEVRVPLLDDELVALAARIPTDLKLRRFRRKYVFKRSMEGVLPSDVIWRRKAGFGAPLRSWLVGELKPMVEDLLSPESVRARGLFDPREVQRLVRANEAGSEDNAMRLWELLTLELWQQTFLDHTPDGSRDTGRALVKGFHA